MGLPWWISGFRNRSHPIELTPKIDDNQLLFNDLHKFIIDYSKISLSPLTK
jgi:hypothetical protein